MPRYLTSSTLWYSGIFAAAATLDAGIKQQRREKWDRAIAEVRQELAQPGAVAEEIRGDISLKDDESMVQDEEPMRFQPVVAEEEGGAYQYMDSETKAEWPTNTGAPLNLRRNAPNSIYAEDWQRYNLKSSRLTPKKVAMTETSVDILLLELVRTLRARDESNLATDIVSQELKSIVQLEPKQISMTIGRAQQRLRILRRADAFLTHYTNPERPEKPLTIPTNHNAICQYRDDQDQRARYAQRELNHSLQQLFKLYGGKEITRPNLLGSILRDLTSSTAPPNLDTFNILLLGFSQTDEPGLVGKVIRAFRRCHQRPNEMTLATVLDHCTKTNNPHSFMTWIERIRGGGSGLALARSGVAITEASQGRLVRHAEHPERIIQLPHHSPIVFGAMIAGVVKFTGFDAALQICQKMGQEGWGLCMAGLTPLLHDCVRRADWNSGMAVWRQILALKEKSRRKDDSRWVSERIRLDTFATMLRLCSRCERREEFDRIWALAIRSHSGAMEKLQRLIRGASRVGNMVDGSLDLAVERSEDVQTRIKKSKTRRPKTQKARNEETGRFQYAELQTPTEVHKELVSKKDTPGNVAEEADGAALDSPVVERTPDLLINKASTVDAASRLAAAGPQHSLLEHASPSDLAIPRTQSTNEVLAVPSLTERAEREAPTPPAPTKLKTRTKKVALATVTPMREEELRGWMPAGAELDEYELRERPMALRA